MPNQQQIEKRELRADGVLSVHSIFETIQGEGPFCGTPCVFIRLAGCNLQCPACDTDYTSRRDLLPVYSIMSAVRSWRKDGLVVITGGEPFRQNLNDLLDKLCCDGYFVQIESNGTLAPTDYGPGAFWSFETDPTLREGVYVVCSPKTGKIHPRVYEVACALKYVVEADCIAPDGLPTNALGHPANPFPARPPLDWDRPVYIQPMDAHDEFLNALNLRAALAASLRFGYTLQLQIHKIIGVE